MEMTMKTTESRNGKALSSLSIMGLFSLAVYAYAMTNLKKCAKRGH
jgi:hypothetical protein